VDNSWGSGDLGDNGQVCCVWKTQKVPGAAGISSYPLGGLTWRPKKRGLTARGPGLHQTAAVARTSRGSPTRYFALGTPRPCVSRASCPRSSVPGRAFPTRIYTGEHGFRTSCERRGPSHDFKPPGTRTTHRGLRPQPKPVLAQRRGGAEIRTRRVGLAPPKSREPKTLFAAKSRE